jgi:hypothetical protein
MSANQSNNPVSNRSANEQGGSRRVNLGAAELKALCQRIVESGVLGRSRHYQALLEYLVQCSIDGKSPKEIELALDVLGKGDDFDVSSDSSVRVYVHQLRKKLDSYYQQVEPNAAQRLVIPKGQYTIAVEERARETSHSPLGVAKPSFWQSRINTGLLATACVLLLLNLVYLTVGTSEQDNRSSQLAANHPIWSSVLQDDKPVLLVMGDYYIFGELNANGNVARMVREFNVNSPYDLEELQFSDIERAENYLDLDLSYMPEGSAFALARIVPILQDSNKPVNITMMSDLTTADIRNNHIVYIGYISALEKLTGLAFAGSGLRIGRSYDELFNEKTAEYYTSDAGLPEAGQPFRDYGLFATFPASIDTQVVLVTGMRDAGLMHTAQALADADSLDDLVIAMESDTDEALASFEALYEVFGIDRMNFDANLVYTNHLDTTQIWGAPLQVEFN